MTTHPRPTKAEIAEWLELPHLDRSHFNFHTQGCDARRGGRCDCDHDYNEYGFKWSVALDDVYPAIARLADHLNERLIAAEEVVKAARKAVDDLKILGFTVSPNVSSVDAALTAFDATEPTDA